MAPAKMPLRADEEMGKKDDDHRPIDARFRPLRHKAIARPRRIIFALVALFLFYEFFKHMPTDLAPAVERYNPAITRLRADTLAKLTRPDQAPTPFKPEEAPRLPDLKPIPKEKEHDGKVMFPELERSFPRYKYSQKTNSRAVLFAGSSLHSVSDLLPLACYMADQPLNYVHFILMGREELSVQKIREINGLKENECPLTWHVGRPDAAPISTDARMQLSVQEGLKLVQDYINPEVIISQGKDWEDSFFWTGIEAHARDSSIPHIALPDASRNLMWIGSLDTAALRLWNKLRIEMVVHAPLESSGSLIRLVKSLDAADYLGSTPSLTIELPERVDPQLLQYLRKPEGLSKLAGHITLRRRIQPHYMDPAEASLRTVESFYPLEPLTTHLLVISPQAELAPSFYHYMKHTALTYKHSAHAKHIFSKLIGISLELPSFKPTTDGESLVLPELTAKDNEHFVPSFLWQAPNSNAALYFGDAWVEFHSFLSSRLSIPESATASHTKSISEKYPAFMEYLLEMIRAKGYYLLYPAFPGTKFSSIVTIHNELYEPPEEFRDSTSSSANKEGDVAGGSASVEKPLGHASTIMPLLDLFSSGYPDLDVLPLLGFNGEQLDAAKYQSNTDAYAQRFRTDYGGCTGDSRSDDSLFCPQE